MLKRLETEDEYKNRDPRLVDITAGSMTPTWSPSLSMVKNYKAGTITWEEYTKMFYQKMRKSYIKNRLDWDMLLGRDTAILGCYCHKNSNCHRFLLAEILQKLGAIYEGEIENGNNY